MTLFPQILARPGAHKKLRKIARERESDIRRQEANMAEKWILVLLVLILISQWTLAYLIF